MRVPEKHAVPPMRGVREALRVCFGLMQRGLPPEIENAFVESLYDFREREWFGVVRTPPRPPEWQEVPLETRRILTLAGRSLIAAHRLPASILDAVERTLVELDALEPRDGG